MGPARRRVVILVAAGVLAAGLGGVAATGAAGAAPAAGQAPALTPNPSLTYNFLEGVSAVSGSDAWAVGSYDDNTTGASKTLVLHWNGTTWSKIESPNPSSSFNELHGVSAVSGSDVWAVGDYWNGTASAYDTLILHWNGTAWSQVNSPNPSPAGPFSSNYLLGVSAVSGSDAWAVGNYDNGLSDSLILHWNGTAWSQVNSPNASAYPSDYGLTGVSAVSGTDAWAVGSYGVNGSDTFSTLVLHWNGTAWSQAASPSPGSGENILEGVSAASGSDAWAAGNYSSSLNPGASSTLILHWNGTAWSQAASPSPSSFSYNFLYGVSAVAGGGAWAVGDYQDNTIGSYNTLILHWNGTAWTQVESPNPSCPDYHLSYNQLYGVSALSGSDAWAVGDYGDCAFATGKAATLVAHWNGTAWANASAITTVTSVSSSSNPVTTGSSVTYTATVANPSPQGGTVAFYDNGSLISPCSPQALSSGKATCSVTYASAGSHAIKAAYSGYADYGGSTSPSLIETVTSSEVWTAVAGTAADISVGANGAVWVLGSAPVTGGHPIYRWNGSGWTHVGGAAADIAVDAHGNPWAVSQQHQIYHWNGSGWVHYAGSATDISAGANGALWALGSAPVTGGHPIYRWNGSGWTHVGGAAADIAVDAHGNPWAVSQQHQIYHWNGSGWVHYAGSATDISAGANGALWALGSAPITGGYHIFRWTSTGWTHVGGAAADIAVDPHGKPWIIDGYSHIYHFSA